MGGDCDTCDNATHQTMLPAPPNLAHTERKAPGLRQAEARWPYDSHRHVALIYVSHLADMVLRPEEENANATERRFGALETPILAGFTQAPCWTEQNMTTLLEKTLKRALTIDEHPYVLAISPDGLKLTLKGRRNGFELRWSDLVSGEAALVTALNASVGQFASVAKPVESTAAKRARRQGKQATRVGSTGKRRAR